MSIRVCGAGLRWPACRSSLSRHRRFKCDRMTTNLLGCSQLASFSQFALCDTLVDFAFLFSQMTWNNKSRSREALDLLSR